MYLSYDNILKDLKFNNSNNLTYFLFRKNEYLSRGSLDVLSDPKAKRGLGQDNLEKLSLNQFLDDKSNIIGIDNIYSNEAVEIYKINVMIWR
jgi:formamidopyrimidine-DNA glycosylase